MILLGNSSIEKYNRQRALKSNQEILQIIQRKKVVKSINKLTKYTDLSYGAIWKAVQRLELSGQIIIVKITDENDREKTVIFSDENAKDDYLQSKISNISKFEVVHLSDLVRKTYLEELFHILLGNREEYINDFKEILIKNGIIIDGEPNVYGYQDTIIDVIEKIMKIDVSSIRMLKDKSNDIEVYIPNE